MRRAILYAVICALLIWGCKLQNDGYFMAGNRGVRFILNARWKLGRWPKSADEVARVMYSKDFGYHPHTFPSGQWYLGPIRSISDRECEVTLFGWDLLGLAVVTTVRVEFDRDIEALIQREVLERRRREDPAPSSEHDHGGGAETN
jgi:hypothetical protein